MKSSNIRNVTRRAKLRGITVSELILIEQEKQIKIDQGFKWCNSCKDWLLNSEFGKAHSYCKQCYRDRSNSRYDLDKQRSHLLKKKYGITSDKYNQMLSEQNHKCYICHIHEDKLDRSLAVDHCHTTGKVRGLLCGNCNRFLGQIDDNINTAERLLEYLNKYKNIQEDC
jgi:hypothetical protein